MMTENVQYEYEYPTSDSTCCNITTCTSHFACNDRTNESYQHRTMNMAAVTGSEATNVCQQQQQQDLHHRVSSETGVDAETESERQQQPLMHFGGYYGRSTSCALSQKEQCISCILAILPPSSTEKQKGFRLGVG